VLGRASSAATYSTRVMLLGHNLPQYTHGLYCVPTQLYTNSTMHRLAIGRRLLYLVRSTETCSCMVALFIHRHVLVNPRCENAEHHIGHHRDVHTPHFVTHGMSPRPAALAPAGKHRTRVIVHYPTIPAGWQLVGVTVSAMDLPDTSIHKAVESSRPMH
jgi:hypothetical protein